MPHRPTHHDRITCPEHPAASIPDEGTEAVLYYDGACPFCSRYVSRLRLEGVAVQLVNARARGTDDELRAEGIDLDEGLALRTSDGLFHGGACLHELALRSPRSDLFNRLNRAVFRSPTRSRLLYPALRAGRNLALRLLGRPRMGRP